MTTDHAMGSDPQLQTRRDLAAAFRLAARRGWDDIVWTHLSAAVPGEPGHYYINRFGLRFCEVTADNLVKVDVQGRVVDGSNAPVNPSGFAIHGCVHAARPDAVCVIHLHTLWGQALAARPEGLLPCSQPALRLYGRLGRHAYEGLAFGADEQRRLVAALGQHDGLILAHHGVLTVGRTVAEAFVLMHWLDRAARIQLQAQAAGGELPLVPPEVVALTQAQWIGDGSTPEGVDEWPALLREAAQS
ncbi:MAG: class II aldolase/adducin family protein [Betaproteobacteria bacterium]|nr:class II aldolase/adducin family protein [Betaproteobacteria bacterium]NBU48801.1 class II aldolase/adducin family protein [Betaproteobacteria bacterium]NBX96440.1 class II aldolase/adducin family protein [Betaproteobacteria bacterium]